MIVTASSLSLCRHRRRRRQQQALSCFFLALAWCLTLFHLDVLRQISIRLSDYNNEELELQPGFSARNKHQQVSSSWNKNSDLVELSHCSWSLKEEAIIMSNFTAWAIPILNQAIQKASTNISETTQQEWKAELLEMYATHSGYCDFSRYRPSVPTNTPDLERAASKIKIQQANSITVPPNSARIVFCIVAYQDAVHLQRLIQAIHQKHHTILIHLERSTPEEYTRQVEDIASHYSNVIILQFGTIIYKTDSVSMINFRIMRWIEEQLEVDYDYFVTMGGAVYPLYNASELSQHMYQANHNVWLGEMTLKGVQVNHPQASLMMQKRLISTSDKRHLHKIGFPFGKVAPNWLDISMRYKTASGNQAVYSKATVQRLLNSSQVAEIFAMAKYGCCCCLEERTWVAALGIIGLLNEAKSIPCTWQAWGGYNSCQGSMHNALLSMNESTCLRVEYPGSNMYVWGNTTISLLKQAKADGFLFARKFRSDDISSMEVLTHIESEIW